jgi:hypothetical protein
VRDAALAAAQTSATDWVRVAMLQGYSGAYPSTK